MNQIPDGWDKNQLKHGASYLQSGLWGEFQKSMGLNVHYLGESDWTVLLLERKTPLGKYLFAPHGPTLDSAEVLSAAVEQLRQYGRRMGADWLSLEPLVPKGDSGSLQSALTGLGARPASHNREPELTRIIDLKPAPDDILAGISQSTRSFIRKNQREHFLKFKTGTEPKDVDLFVNMLAKVTDRKNVHFFTPAYFQKQAELLMPAGMLVLELALESGVPIASALIHDYGGLSSYTYAASLPEARHTSASALLLWQAMINAKARGQQRMDLFGIAPDDAPAIHPWAGFSAFKRKFGGQVVRLAGTWDLPLTAKYKLYRSAQSARRLTRRH